MSPDNPSVRILPEESPYRLSVRMRVQHESVPLGQLHDTMDDRQIRIRAMHVKLTDRDVPVPRQPFFEVREHRFITKPARGFAGFR
jgi:hypothetical protein